MKKWEQKLKELKNKYNKMFYVQQFLTFPKEWLLYDSEKYYKFIETDNSVNHREIMDDEIVIDIDIDVTTISKKEAKENTSLLAEKIYNKLIMNDFSFECFDSGGNGWHFHLYFPELMNVKNKDERNLIKKEFQRWLGWGNLEDKDNTPHVCTVTKTLIQLEYSKHRKGGTKTYKKEWSNNTLNTNKIPSIVYEHKALTEENRRKLVEKYKNQEEPFWVKIFESPFCAIKKDGRDRVCFILTAWYCRKYGVKEATKRIYEWNKKILNNYHSKTTLNAKLKTCAKSNKIPYNYAIELLEDLGYDIEQHKVKK